LTQRAAGARAKPGSQNPLTGNAVHALTAVRARALRTIADRLERGEVVPGPMDVSFVVP